MIDYCFVMGSETADQIRGCHDQSAEWSRPIMEWRDTMKGWAGVVDVMDHNQTIRLQAQATPAKRNREFLTSTPAGRKPLRSRVSSGEKSVAPATRPSSSSRALPVEVDDDVDDPILILSSPEPPPASSHNSSTRRSSTHQRPAPRRSQGRWLDILAADDSEDEHGEAEAVEESISDEDEIQPDNEDSVSARDTSEGKGRLEGEDEEEFSLNGSVESDNEAQENESGENNRVSEIVWLRRVSTALTGNTRRTRQRIRSTSPWPSYRPQCNAAAS
eukprot:c13741_g1_i1.p1 GENE.c13741_g1_i1~~c13741_g1_i1.p1  ORF type:complete len:274 (-),score=38.51 c13741_g1_i1:1406-2227(-)